MVEDKLEKDLDSHSQEFRIKSEGNGELQKAFGYRKDRQKIIIIIHIELFS